MGFDPSEILVPLGHFAADIAKALCPRVANVFPVLGAEGDNFFIQICEGDDFVGRKVHKIIHVGLDVHDYIIGAADGIEVSITLPDASCLIALMSLLQQALNTQHIRIHHPLDDYGDFLPYWDIALTAASPCMPS